MRRLLFIGLGVLIVAGVLWLVVTALTPPVITVEWSTASELNTAGFNIYRSLSPDDPGMRLNAAPIPASPDPLVGGSYVYTDTAVTPGQTYYYHLEEVETSGRLSPQGVVSATASGGYSALLPVSAVVVVVLLAVWLWPRPARPQPSSEEPQP